MQPQTLYIIRHGESVSNIDKTARATIPDHKITLSELGEQQCLELGKRLANHIQEPIAIWTSPYTRARQTTQLFSQGLSHIPILHREDPRIREQDWGNYYTEFEHTTMRDGLDNHSRFFFRMPHGEAGTDVFDRVSSFLEMLHRENTSNTVVISTHGMTAMIFLMRLLHWTYEEYETTDWFHNCGFVRFEQINGAYQMALDCRQG
jgi:broad specificity phosphatase PhoE